MNEEAKAIRARSLQAYRDMRLRCFGPKGGEKEDPLVLKAEREMYADLWGMEGTTQLRLKRAKTRIDDLAKCCASLAEETHKIDMLEITRTKQRAYEHALSILEEELEG